MPRIGELDLEDAANAAAGNWRRFQCFVWLRDNEIEDPQNWTVIYTHHRDSGLLDQSNAAVIRESLATYANAEVPDVVFESHSHWAVGHIDGFSLRVYRDGEITEAFRTYHRLAELMAEYPILDEADYSERETETTFENLTDAAWPLKHEFELPEGWEGDVYSWLSDYNQSAIENRDDQGGYPEEDDLREAFKALGYALAA